MSDEPRINSTKSSQEIWILGATLVTQDEERRVLKKNLKILNGVIVEITSKKPPAKAKKILASGKYIFPGFVQTHVHLCQTLFRNWADDLELLDWLGQKIWPFEAAHTEETLYTSACLGIYELLSSGTTTILDMGTVRHNTVIAEAVKQFGIRASVGKCLMDDPDYTPSYLRDKTKQGLKEAVDLFEKWNGKLNDRIRISFAPRFVISCTEPLLKEVATLSQKKDILIHTHASENREEIKIVRKKTGLGNIEYLSKLGFLNQKSVLAHCVWIESGEMDILKKSKSVAVAHCPSSNLKLASGIAPILDFKKNGIRVSLGADGAPCNNNLNMLQEMKLAALIQKPKHGPKAFSATEALDLATREGAKALHWFDQIGSIEVGKKADLICFDLNRPQNAFQGLEKEPSLESIASALVYSTSPAELNWTMVDGKMLYESGQVKGISAEKLVAMVLKSRKKITANSLA